jgi:hypothetical protein
LPLAAQVSIVFLSFWGAISKTPNLNRAIIILALSVRRTVQ